MFQIIRKAVQHKIVTVNYPAEPLTNPAILGKPVVDHRACTRCGTCASQCPVEAIAAEPQREVSIALDRCIFCSHCERVCPQKAICMDNDFELAEPSRERLGGNSDAEASDPDWRTRSIEDLGEALSSATRKIFGRSLHIREVSAGSCNGCDSEINALGSPYNDLERFGIHFVASPRHADVLLVTGCPTRNMEEALIRTLEATPHPRMIIACGSCALSGGIFRNSYATRNGADRVVPVDMYIPGCPPRPQALIYGILKTIERRR